MSGCKRQCDWDDNQVCRSCGIDYSPPKPPAESTQDEASKSEVGESTSTKSDDDQSEESEPHETGKQLRPFHLAFPVDDLPAARKFYTEVLGCTTGRE